MRVEVIQKFKDKHTGEIRNVGDVLDVTQERFDEIMTVGEFVKEVEEASPSRAELETWKKDELVKLAEDMGLDSAGTKANIIDRIIEAAN